MGLIIGITGTTGAGKGESVSFFKARGFDFYSVRDVIKMKLAEQSIYDPDRDQMLAFGNSMRQKNPAYFAEELLLLARMKDVPAVVESIRAKGEVDFLKKQKDTELFSIDANVMLRYARITERKSETDKISYEKFLLQNQAEWNNEDPSMPNIKYCMEQTDERFRHLNDGTPGELHRQLEQSLKLLGF